MAYPENVGIKAMEIYVPNQVSKYPWTSQSLSHLAYDVSLKCMLTELHSAWIRLFLNSIKEFQLENTLSGLV